MTNNYSITSLLDVCILIFKNAYNSVLSMWDYLTSPLPIYTEVIEDMPTWLKNLIPDAWLEVLSMPIITIIFGSALVTVTFIAIAKFFVPK